MGRFTELQNEHLDRPMIDSYIFGKIVIDGQDYDRDVIVYPDYVERNWWRKEGHELCIDDIKSSIERESP